MPSISFVVQCPRCKSYWRVSALTFNDNPGVRRVLTEIALDKHYADKPCRPRLLNLKRRVDEPKLHIVRSKAKV